jgi:restriction system protein
MEVLRELEWKRFEILCGAYYAKRGFRVETIACGADGGIDAKLYYGQIKEPVGLVQCKAWSNRLVGVKPIRELLGVMVHNKVAKGIFHATGTFTNEALEFAGANKIQLIGGEDLISNIRTLADTAQQELLALAVEGDYKTPTCPSCAVKMRRISSKRGDFWGCTNYPRCKVKWNTAQLPG